MAKESDIVYSVWGPSPDWPSGYGALGWFATREEAEYFVKQDKRFIKKEGLDSTWPYTLVRHVIEEKPVSELVENGLIRAELAKTMSIEDIAGELNVKLMLLSGFVRFMGS